MLALAAFTGTASLQVSLLYVIDAVLQIRSGNRGYFMGDLHIFPHKHILIPYQNRLAETVLMKLQHMLWLRITKIKLSLNCSQYPLLFGALTNGFQNELNATTGLREH